MSSKLNHLLFTSALLLGACGEPAEESGACPGPGCPGCPGPTCAPAEDDGKADGWGSPDFANPAAGTMVLYEVQARTANACDPEVGADWQRQACLDKVAPQVSYRAEGESCEILSDLEQIRLGTLDDMLVPTADFREGITLQYIDERVGANTVWMMPMFPSNDEWSLPHPCDNLGSPYAVRDYFHINGSLSQACIAEERDEHDEEPCFGNDVFDDLIQDAHRRGLKVMMDVAFNHFGHNYLMYDYADYRPIIDRIDDGEDLNQLWDFEKTHEEALLKPSILDNEAALSTLKGDAKKDLQALEARCPDLEGHVKVRAYHMWRNALQWERDQFPCDSYGLEYVLPGFYSGKDPFWPAKNAGDTFTNDWHDVKFLFHQSTNTAHTHELAREREYLFRVMNYWVSRGVDGFRLDHSTDFYGGMSPDEWRYILGKVNYYAAKRGQNRPVYLAEEFFTQQGMAEVVDILTEGYVFDMRAEKGQTKDASRVEKVIANMDRFAGKAYVMTALETHDEQRLTHHTGFDQWTGAGFWAIGASTWSTPMLLMGQEFGEVWGVGFKRNDFIRSRFEGSNNYIEDADALVDFYHQVITGRLSPENRALYSAPRAFLRTRDGQVDERIFAQAKWSGDGNVVFVLHNLWRQDVSQVYRIPQEVADALWLRRELRYRLVDVLGEREVAACRPGSQLMDEFYVAMGADERLQWLRLEACD